MYPYRYCTFKNITEAKLHLVLLKLCLEAINFQEICIRQDDGLGLR